MNFLKLVLFLRSGLGIFLICAIGIGLLLPTDFLEIIGFIIGIGIMGFIIFYLIKIFF